MSELLIICVGECSAGGYVPLDQLSPSVPRLRPAVSIWNNISWRFEPLHIGVNGFLQHDPFGPNEYVGWETAIAQEVETGSLPEPLHLVKCAQGSALIWHWWPQNHRCYFQTMQMRVNAARWWRPEHTPVVWYSQGINDNYAFNPLEFYAQVLTFFHYLREFLPDVPIVMTTMPPKYEWYNPLIKLIPESVSRLRVVDYGDELCDMHHLNLSGIRNLVRRMSAATMEVLHVDVDK